MLQSEKKSLIRFLLIYLGSTFLLFSMLSWIFYTSQKHQLFDQQRETLKFQAAQIKQKLRNLHTSFNAKLVYPSYPSLDSAIFDMNREYIFGTGNETELLTPQEYIEEDNRLYYLTKVEPHYLGAAFLLVHKALDREPIINLQKSIVLFLLGAGLFFTLLGIFLGRLFVAPMRDSMERMNNFIQDTTHELNTPISTILTNIEMIETFGKCEKSEELKRIEIASKTLSRIYDDLTYLNLNHHYHRHIETINISSFVEERMVYFTTMSENKSLTLKVNIEPNIMLEIDKNDMTRLVDNLISNAIKYNRSKGLLSIVLTKEMLAVKDTGVGIDEKDLISIFQRFKRANKSEGGFGIGLDIVNQVIHHYDFVLEINSELHKGTEVIIKWQK